MEAVRLIQKARHGSGMTQRELAERAGTSQATLSAYECGRKSPTLDVAERIVEAAGYRLDLVTQVHFTLHAARGVRPFWVPDRLWRGKLPECFATIRIADGAYIDGSVRLRLRRRPSRRRLYELLLRNGLPDELMDWIDGALLVDIWDELKLPKPIRRAWQPVIDLAGNGPVERPTYRGPMDALGGQNPMPGGEGGGR
ncbi:MAG TPA: helix-turn-helix transcriptional regulator [Nocardioides sp.]|nr:helix-turn-helix transcriptional regulator [Nocardioides sp.]